MLRPTWSRFFPFIPFKINGRNYCCFVWYVGIWLFFPSIHFFFHICATFWHQFIRKWLKFKMNANHDGDLIVIRWSFLHIARAVEQYFHLLLSAYSLNSEKYFRSLCFTLCVCVNVHSILIIIWAYEKISLMKICAWSLQ